MALAPSATLKNLRCAAQKRRRGRIGLCCSQDGLRKLAVLATVT